MVEFIPHVSTATKVLDDLTKIKHHRSTLGVYHPTPASGVDNRPLLHLPYFEIAFSFAGLQVLDKTADPNPTVTAAKDPFKTGQFVEAVPFLGDKADPRIIPTPTAPKIPYWEPLWRDNTVHGVIVTASESMSDNRLAAAV